MIMMIVRKLRFFLIVKCSSLFLCLIRFMVVQVIVMFWGEIILLVMFLVVLVVIVSVGLMLICCVVICCRLLKSVLDEVFELVRNMLSQLSIGENSGNRCLVCVRVSVIVVFWLEQLVMQVKFSMNMMLRMGQVSFFSVFMKVCMFLCGFMFSIVMLMSVVRKMLVLVFENQFSLQFVVQGVGLVMMGVIFIIWLCSVGMFQCSIMFESVLCVLRLKSVLNVGKFYIIMNRVSSKKGDYVLSMLLVVMVGIIGWYVVFIV